MVRPAWICARSQSSGRGRRNRGWDSPEGNLHATLCLRLAETPATAAYRSFVAALAVRDSCKELASRRSGFRLKWPNDVLLKGRKLAGILLECSTYGPADCSLRIGIGVNLLVRPRGDLLDAGALQPARLCRDGDPVISPEVFLRTLDRAFARREGQIRENGFDSIRRDWLRHAYGIGSCATVRLENDVFRGIFRTIDDSGCAIFETGGSIRKVSAADVNFREYQDAAGH